MAKSYCDYEIWQMAHELAVRVHKMTLEKLPKFEMYEEASQIRRSSKSISSNIVEGFGRKRYKNDFIRFLIYALASCDETRDHLEFLFETGSLKDASLYEELSKQYDILGKKLNNFLKRVVEQHFAPKEVSRQQIVEK